jgi:hypothetical protein
MSDPEQPPLEPALWKRTPVLLWKTTMLAADRRTPELH